MPENKRLFPLESSLELEWIDETIPRSALFGDTYFSRHGGIGETSEVFIGWNELPARWPAMDECQIGELGFGTGLNFLETLRQWRALKKPGATLHFFSVEAFPMQPQDLAKALSRWPQLADLAAELIHQWHGEGGSLQATFGDDASLTIHFADALETLRHHTLAADAWYLDGFAPARNPQMWSAELMAEVCRNTKPGGTFATYTAAGWVRRNLQAAGFTVEKRPGFAGKREMLRGGKAA
jgi:tRNA U34 5-methylaminomethyl-2-thiouridine-forming methyltransferase MnmC